MKYAIALLAILALSVPAFAQETETLPDGRKVRIQVKDGSVIIDDETDEAGSTEESDLPAELKEVLKRFREQVEQMRKDMEERMKKVREEVEKKRESHTGPDGEEVEEYEHKSADGKTHVKIKIVRVRKSGSGGETPKAPEEPKKETERKQ